MQVTDSLKNKILCSAIFLQILLLTVRQSFLFIAPGSTIIRLFFIFCSGVPVLFSLPIIIKEKPYSFVMLYLITICSSLFSILFHYYTTEFIIAHFFELYLMCLPTFLCMLSLSDFRALYKYGKTYSLLIFFASIFYLFCNMRLGRNLADKINYNMSLGYKMLLPAILFFYYYLIEKNFLYLVCSLLTTFIILVLGSRGPVACFGFFVIFSTLIKKKDTKEKIKVVLFVLFVACSFFFLNDIADFFISFFEKNGINARSLKYLKGGAFFSNESGRDVLRHIGFIGFMDNFYFGMGLFGDRLLNNGMYIHNFALEILIQFGFIVGSFLLVVFFSFLALRLIKSSNRLYLLALLSFGFIHLFLSASYLQDPAFYIFMGAFFNKRISRAGIEVKNGK